MKTTSIGHQAEIAAAEYLKGQKFKIIDLNWRTRYCEIDIVAQKESCVFFVEVKYRKSNNWGSGLDYITHSKQKQMALAAEMWVSTHDWQGEYCLSAVEVSGEDFVVTDVILEL
jgi:uncharacterized protein (TIGR00252 family)